MRFFKKIFGWWFILNCVGNPAPALVFNWNGFRRKVYNDYLKQWVRPSWCSFTVRTKSHRETTIYWHGFRIWWNSDHIAYKFGEHSDHSQYGGPPDVWQYSGWLGNHTYL